MRLHPHNVLMPYMHNTPILLSSAISFLELTMASNAYTSQFNDASNYPSQDPITLYTTLSCLIEGASLDVPF